MMTRFQDEDSQRRAMPVNLSRGQLSSQANTKTFDNLSNKINLEAQIQTGSHGRVNSTLDLDNTPQHLVG